MKRFPRLQISFLDQIFSFMRVPQEERGGTIKIRQMRHRCSLETFELNLRTKKQTMLQTNFSQNQWSGGPEWQSQAAATSRVHRLCSIEPCCHAADDYRPKTAVRGATRSGDVSASAHFQNAKLLRQETEIALFDGFFGPLIDVGVPDWAVISGSCGNAAKRVVRAMPVQKRGAHTLTLRILAAAFRRAVGGDKDPLHSTSIDVIDPGFDSAQPRSESVHFDGRHCGITGLGGDVEDRLTKAVTVDQRECDGAIRRINRDYLIMPETIVRVSVWEVYKHIVHRGGNDRGVVNDAVYKYQRAVVRITDRAGLGDAGREGLILRAGHELAVRTEVYNTGIEQERPIGAACGGAC